MGSGPTQARLCNAHFCALKFKYGVYKEVWGRAKSLGLSNEDLVATVTAFTAESIAKAYQDFVPNRIDQVILGGGGTLNCTLVGMLRRRLAPAEVLVHEDLGLSSVAKESVGFALLAYESWHNRPGTLPSCTGADRPVVLGHIVPGDNYEALLERKWREQELVY